jgi:drug/metabolite transporter (DMT)-like permease
MLLLVCGNGGVSLAEHGGVASGVAALAVATMPLFTLLFGLFWGQRPRRLELAGILLGMAGIVLLNLGSNLQGNPVGAVLLVLASAAWAFGSVWSRYLPTPPGIMGSAAQMLVAGVVLLFASQLSGERLQQLPDWQGWAALLYLVFFGSMVAFSAYLYLLRTVRPAAATSYCYVNPVVAVLLGIVFAGERIHGEEWLAMLVILLGVILIGLPQWRRAQ